MAGGRLHRSTEDAQAERRAWWARVLRIGADRPLRRRPQPRIEPVHRSWLASFWHSRVAVQAGVSLDDFLRSRLARHLAGLHLPRGTLPLTIEIEDGRLSISPAPPAPAPRASADADAWLAPLVALEGPPVRREVAELELRLGALDSEIVAARRRAEERARQLASDVALGLVVGPADVDATAEQLGRPPIRSGAPRALALGFAAAVLAAETWQIAQPLLRGAGLDVSALRTEAARSPAEVAFAAVFALAIAASLVALAHAGVGAAAALFAEGTDDRRRPALATAVLGAGGAATLVAAAVAALPGSTSAASMPGASLVLLLLAVALAAVLAVRAARPDAARREAELAAALAWDRERARALGERARRMVEVSSAEDEVRVLERRREAARRRLRVVNARAAAAARLEAEAAQREQADLARAAQSIVAALELDRYEFVRQASARGALELLAPRRRKPADPLVAGPEPLPEPQLRPAPGRLAS